VIAEKCPKTTFYSPLVIHIAEKQSTMGKGMSTFEKWRAGGEIIGLFSLVASLIFVGLQIQQSQEIALSQAYQARSDQSMAVMLAGIEDEAVRSFWKKAYGFVDDDLTDSERVVGVQLAGARLVHWENVHYQYLRGFVSAEHWQTQLTDMQRLMPNPIFRPVYERNKESWRASFREVLDSALAGRP
jgi:hypothetical protein